MCRCIIRSEHLLSATRPPTIHKSVMPWGRTDLWSFTCGLRTRGHLFPIGYEDIFSQTINNITGGGGSLHPPVNQSVACEKTTFHALPYSMYLHWMVPVVFSSLSQVQRAGCAPQLWLHTLPNALVQKTSWRWQRGLYAVRTRSAERLKGTRTLTTETCLQRNCFKQRNREPETVWHEFTLLMSHLLQDQIKNIYAFQNIGRHICSCHWYLCL